MSDQMSRDLANLRLQVEALAKLAQGTSLSEGIAQMRSTVRWSAFALAVAFVVSTVMRMPSNAGLSALRLRVERLEHFAEKPLQAAPPM